MPRQKPTHAAIAFYVTPMHKIAHPFPLDMLRRDRCVPRTEEDAHKIERTVRYDSTDEGIIIGVERFYPVGGLPDPTVGRWESFGWRLLTPAELEAHTKSNFDVVPSMHKDHFYGYIITR